MSEISNYEEEVAKINALTDEETKAITVPVNDFLQESENLYQWCLPDKDQLTNKGLDETLISSLPTRTAICREAQAKWVAEQKAIKDAKKIWQEKWPIAEKLLDQLIADCRYAFRKNPNLTKSVTKIASGKTNAEMIQALSDIAELGSKNIELLTATNFDATKLETAKNSSSELASILAQVNQETNTKKPALIFRDKSYTYLQIAVDEIRNCGKYVFREDENRVKGYFSEYHHKLYQKKKSKKDNNKNKDEQKDIE